MDVKVLISFSRLLGEPLLPKYSRISLKSRYAQKCCYVLKKDHVMVDGFPRVGGNRPAQLFHSWPVSRVCPFDARFLWYAGRSERDSTCVYGSVTGFGPGQ